MQTLALRMRGWSAPRRQRALGVCLVVSLTIAIVGGAVLLPGMYSQSDSKYYLDMAAGKPAILPFASRQLAPLLVKLLVQVSGLSVKAGFAVLGLLCIVVFEFAAFSMLVRTAAPRFMLAAVAGMIFWAKQFNALVMPDLLYAALLVCFLLLLRAQRFVLAGLMMFPLVVARESTLLTLVCLLIAGWRLLRWREVLAAVLALLAGVAVVKHLTANALPNRENISPALYMLAKLPWNILKNFFGLDLWANVYTVCGVPRYVANVHLGPLHQIGVCGFEWHYRCSCSTQPSSRSGCSPCC